MEGGESGGAATVHSHGPPPPPPCRYAVGKLPDLTFCISLNLDLKKKTVLKTVSKHLYGHILRSKNKDSRELKAGFL